MFLACASVGVAATDASSVVRSVDGSELFLSLSSKPASSVVSEHPDEARDLTLDLIFYRWACSRYGLDPEIPNLDKTIGSLTAVSKDPGVAWAASELGRKEWTVRALPSEDDERAKILKDAERALNDGISKSDAHPTQSIERLSACAALLNKSGSVLSYALVCERIAERQLYAVRRYREARTNYERAWPVFGAYELRTRVARVYDDLGHLETAMGRYDDARMDYVASSGEWKALERGDLAGKQLVNAGIALAALNQTTTALATMRTGLSLCRGYVANYKNSHVTLVQLLMQVAESHAAAGDTESQALLLKEAKLRADETNEPLLTASVLQAQAVMFSPRATEPRSRQCLSEREKILSAAASKGAEALTKLVDLSISSAEQSDLLAVAEKGAAAGALIGKNQQAAEMLTRLVDLYRVLSRRDDQIRCLRGLAAQYTALGKNQEALLVRKDATEIAMAMGKHSVAVEILRDIEESALAAEDTGTALEALREAVDVIGSSGNTLALADVLESRGLLLQTAGQLSLAISSLESSRDIYLAELAEPWTPAEVLQRLAEAQVKDKKPLDAIASLTTAVQRIEQWAVDERVDPNAERGRSNTLSGLYSQLVKLQISQGRKTDAIARINSAKSYVWYERFRSDLAQSADPETAEALKATEGGAVAVQPPTTAGGGRKIAGNWQSVLTQVPQFSRIARGNRNPGAPGPIDAGDIFNDRDGLPQGLVVIEYALTDSSAYVLIATRSSASCWELPAPKERIRVAVDALRAALRESENRVDSGIRLPPVVSWTDPSILPIVAPLSELGGMLFEPIRSELAQLHAKTLAFVLPDDLGGVPFHAIPKDVRGSYRFLIQDYAVTYVAPGMLRALVNTHPGSLNPKTCRVGVFYDSSGNLPGAPLEKNVIRACYKNCVAYTSTLATADRFVTTASSCSVVHVATHHQADPNPSKFSIVLSNAQGGKVRVEDMLKISNPNLQLAVLSACDTMGTSDAEALGTAYTAQIFGLAGFPSIIGGLWKVSDDASVNLMNSFYGKLSTAGKAQALKIAQVNMIQSKDGKFRNPFYWASFALYGDPR
jgi:tetratricopeptide (TPR) repeat protein